MTLLLPALTVAFAAFAVWLGVRIVNRRERWAKWTFAMAVGLPTLYVASFGPACMLLQSDVLDFDTVATVYSPLALTPWWVEDCIAGYAGLYGTGALPIFVLAVGGGPRDVATLLFALTVAFAAFAVWLGVRIVNRRERWAKWTFAMAVGLPTLYVASFGPVCWVSSRTGIGKASLPWIYRPLLALMKIDDSPADLRLRLTLAPLGGTGPTTLYFYPSGVMSRYASWFAAEDWQWRYLQAVQDRSTEIVRVSAGRWEWRNATGR